MQEQPTDSTATPEHSIAGEVPEPAPPPASPEARTEVEAPPPPAPPASDEEDPAEAAGRAEFAALLDKSMVGPAAKPPKEIKVGSRVRCKIV